MMNLVFEGAKSPLWKWAFMLALVTAVGCSGGESSDSDDSGTDPGTEDVAPDEGGGDDPGEEVGGGGGGQAVALTGGFNVSGTVSFEGTARVMSVIDMPPTDPKCDMHTEPVTAQSLLVSTTGGLKNAFVYVKNPPAGDYTAPSTPALLDQNGCMYEPHVFGVMKGQGVDIKNSDPTTHNIHGMGKFYEFNFAQTRKITRNWPTRRAEIAVPIKCDVHSWMKTYMHVMDHPFFAVTDAEGNFEIANLPAGTYTLVYWHEDEMMADQEVEITVSDTDLTGQDVSFKAAGM